LARAGGLKFLSARLPEAAADQRSRLYGSFSMLLSNNANTGGTCFSDSGGPSFIGSSNVIGGVTSFGINGNCAGTGGVYRMDRADALEFLRDFVEIL
jgi:secreted trypsin-like serine protease